MKKFKTAIIGDRFMKTECFREALKKICGDRFDIKTKELPWPDVPMEHGYVKSGLENLKEYQGEPDEITEFIGDAEILINHLAPVSAKMIPDLTNLKLIVVSRGGPTNIDIQTCRDKGILVENVPGRNASAVAEFTIAAILIETRNIRAGHEQLRQGHWAGDLYRYDKTGRELCEMTVGIIGYGNIGTKVVKLLKPFGCKILVCDPYAVLDQQDKANGVKQVSRDELLQNSDIVSLHPRVTDETQRMINRETIEQMKDGAYLINTARGPLMDYQSVYEGLTSGKIRGAMLETFAMEPPKPDDPILKLPNVTLTPHIAGASIKTVHYAAEQCAEKVKMFLRENEPG